MAERKDYDLTALEQHYDQLEKQMLDEFYGFVLEHQNFKWLYWNMRDVQYGFPAIAHRYRVLKGKPVKIHNSKLYDLSRLLINIHGERYISHPRLESLVEKNKITKLSFLNGAEEADAFINKEYVRLHQSTLRKVDVLANILDREDSGILKTNSSWWDIYGFYPQAIGEFLKEKWWIAGLLLLLGIISDVLGIIDFIPKG